MYLQYFFIYKNVTFYFYVLDGINKKYVLSVG